jgi:hypothetical protein
MTEGENNAQRNEFRLLDFQDRCPDCDVAVGEAHIYDEVDGPGVLRTNTWARSTEVGCRRQKRIFTARRCSR